jgi:hypothetical protein
VLARFGIETTYYDPLIGAGIEELIRSNTRIIYMESPGSLTFEVQDVPAIVEAARARGVLTMLDNTWATPLYFKALAHGVDLCIHAATKYIGGHSDLMMGTASCGEALYKELRSGMQDQGAYVSPDDCYLALRGLRTLSVRLERHQAAVLQRSDRPDQHPDPEPDHGVGRHLAATSCTDHGRGRAHHRQRRGERRVDHAQQSEPDAGHQRRHRKVEQQGRSAGGRREDDHHRHTGLAHRHQPGQHRPGPDIEQRRRGRHDRQRGQCHCQLHDLSVVDGEADGNRDRDRPGEHRAPPASGQSPCISQQRRSRSTGMPFTVTAADHGIPPKSRKL